jgi:hypothetical protein
MADVQTSEVYAKFAPVNMDYEILYADRSAEDKQLLIRAHLQKSKNTNMTVG